MRLRREERMEAATILDSRVSMVKARPWDAVFGNVDLLIQILLYIPTKDLLKLKCVSKQWYSVISDPDFCRNHVLRYYDAAPTALLFSGDYLPSPYFETVSLTPHSSPINVPNFDYLDVSCAMILSSCNGLLLCSAFFRSAPDKSREIIEGDCSLRCYDFNYFTCNPTTKQFKPIPIPNWELPHQFDKSFLYLAFEPLKSPNYKVISLRKAEDYSNLRVDIYSSATGFWNDTEVRFIPPRGMGIASGVYCKGAIHWYSTDEYSFYFDVDSQCLKPMPMPQRNWYRLNVGYFGESRDHLHMAVIDRPNLVFEILEMKDDYSGWSSRYYVHYGLMRSWFPELVRDDAYSILCVVEGKEDDDSVVVLLVGSLVMSHNLRYLTLEKLQDMEPWGINANSHRISDGGYTSLNTNRSGVFLSTSRACLLVFDIHYTVSISCSHD